MEGEPVLQLAGSPIFSKIMENTWTKLPPLLKPGELSHGGCLNCPPAHAVAPMNTLIAVGFGDAHISKDGEVVFDGERADDFHELGEFEALAKADPNHDWRLVLNAPLHSREYQRQGEGAWVLVEQGEGFA
jgi:hypothetical protein